MYFQGLFSYLILISVVILQINGECTETLKLGSKGECVKVLQKHLGAFSDGYFGLSTEKAVKKYQQNNYLTADGVVGFSTWLRINANKKGDKKACGDYLSRGSKGECVKIVQKFVGANVDGVYGSSTVAAVKNLQRKNKLWADGVVGPKVWKIINRS